MEKHEINKNEEMTQFLSKTNCNDLYFVRVLSILKKIDYSGFANKNIEK